jgi:hypothetical protein
VINVQPGDAPRQQRKNKKIKTLDKTSAKPARQHRASAGSLGSVHLNELVHF